MNPKEKDDEIIELTDEELDEIFAEDNFDNSEDGSVIRSFYFSNPDPYAKVEPRPDDAPLFRLGRQIRRVLRPILRRQRRIGLQIRLRCRFLRRGLVRAVSAQLFV